MYLEDSFGESSTSSESLIYVSCKNIKVFDYLVFTDSRGLVNNEDDFNGSYVYKLNELLDTVNLNYLILSRPKNLTVFATLFNFLNLNSDITFKYLVTNLGFVDCTPKKIDNINDILLQINQFDETDNIIVEHENYILNNGTEEVLKSIVYSKEYMKKFNELLNKKFEKLFFINTPVIPFDAKMDRIRPKSFFNQLNKTNDLIDELTSKSDKSILIDISKFYDTYDDVHYTTKGHRKIFNKIKESIIL